MSRHLILAGGGHAHLTVLANLSRLLAEGHRVTVVQPSDYHYYSGMGPGMLGGTYTPAEIRFATRQTVEARGGTFLTDRIERVDPAVKAVHLAGGGQLSYDLLSFNLGSYVPRTMVTGDMTDIYTVKPIETLISAGQRVREVVREKPAALAVVGGGPAAVEIAGNLWQLARQCGGNTPAIHLLAGGTLMSRFPRPVREKVRRLLDRRGIAVHENDRVQSVATGCVTLASGRTRTADIVFLAPGVKPSPVFAASGLPLGPDGGLPVNQYLQCPDYPDLFGGGDCIHFLPRPLDKVGVYAVRQNPVLFHNLRSALNGGPLRPFDPGGDYLLIFNLGECQGVLKKRGITLRGRMAFGMKDYIDRRFMKTFQQPEQP